MRAAPTALGPIGAGATGWGKFWLAMLGLYDWRGVNPVLPELWALPRWLPVHPSKFYCGKGRGPGRSREQHAPRTAPQATEACARSRQRTQRLAVYRLGVHTIGETASEVVHIGLIAMMMEATHDVFIRTCFNYPTLGELYKYATYDAMGALQRRNAGNG